MAGGVFDSPVVAGGVVLVVRGVSGPLLKMKSITNTTTAMPAIQPQVALDQDPPSAAKSGSRDLGRLGSR
jgi:hypothetical protein